MVDCITIILSLILGFPLLAYYVILIPYGLLIKRQQLIKIWHKFNDILKEAYTTLKEFPEEWEDFLNILHDLNTLPKEKLQDEIDPYIQKITQILRNRPEILEKLTESLPVLKSRLNRQPDPVVAETHNAGINDNKKINESKKSIMNLESNPVNEFYTLQMNVHFINSRSPEDETSTFGENISIIHTDNSMPKESINKATRDILRFKSLSNSSNKNRIWKCWCPLSLARFMAIIIFLLGVLFNLFFPGIMFGNLITLRFSDMIKNWETLSLIFYIICDGIILFCYLSSIAIFEKVFAFEFHCQKCKKYKFGSEAFSTFKRLLPLVIVNGISIIISILALITLSIFNQINISECTEESFEQYRICEYIVVGIVSLMPFTMAVDSFLLRGCSAINSPTLLQVFRFIICWRIHPPEK